MLKISVTLYTDKIYNLFDKIQDFVARSDGRLRWLLCVVFFALSMHAAVLWGLGLIYTFANFGIEVAFPFTGYFAAPHWWITIVWLIVTLTLAAFLLEEKDSSDTEA